MRDRISVNETTRSLPLRSTNVYDLLSPVPTKDTHVSVEDPAAGKGTCTSDGEASQPSKESPEQSFSLKDDGLAETFAIHYVVTVSLMFQDAALTQTNLRAELGPHMHENQRGLG